MSSLAPVSARYADPNGFDLAPISRGKALRWKLPKLAAKDYTTPAVVRFFHANLIRRMRFLRCEGQEDGISLSDSSKLDFWRFVQARPNMRECNLVLTDTGNLRASWRDENGTHAGLQFLGDDMVQFVIFKPREFGKVARVAGRDVLQDLDRHFAAFGIVDLIGK